MPVIGGDHPAAVLQDQDGSLPAGREDQDGPATVRTRRLPPVSAMNTRTAWTANFTTPAHTLLAICLPCVYVPFCLVVKRPGFSSDRF
jgi:hypothetical protein